MEKRKVIIGVDLDGVCANYYDALRRLVAAKYGVPENKIEEIYPAPSTYDMAEWPDFKDNFVKYHSEAVLQGIYTLMKPIGGASETLWKMSEEGYHLRVITSRFVKHGQNAQVISDTAVWLDKNSIPYRDIIFAKDKADIYADIYIDDSPDNVMNLKMAGRKVITFDAPYNQELEGLRAKNWDDVYRIIKQKFPLT
jgi:5'(3')-deoxyribonucleotidase